MVKARVIKKALHIGLTIPELMFFEDDADYSFMAGAGARHLGTKYDIIVKPGDEFVVVGKLKIENPGATPIRVRITDV